MSKLLKIGLPLLLVGAFLIYKFTQPKGELDIRRADTEMVINASSLYTDFEADETKANDTYAGKVIEVSGALSSVTKDEAGHYVVHLNADSPMGGITCNLTSNEGEPTAAAKIGDSVTIKGVCTGFLFDVVLDNAILVHH